MNGHIDLRRMALWTAAWLGMSSLLPPTILAQTGTCATAPGVPMPPADATTIAPGSGADDTTRIQQAIDALKGGKWLVFQPGTYRFSAHLNVGVSGVTLYGVGATLSASNPTDGALMIEGDNVDVYGFTMTQSSTSRQSTPWAGGISVYDDRSGTPRRVTGTVIQNNTVNFSGGSGIFVFKTTNFTIAGNTVYRSWSDGIHMTGGSRNGRVVNNKVRQTGDDMIAVVSYAGVPGATASVRYANWAAAQDDLDSGIYVGGNDVSDQYWGRGISVVGGTDVTIENNSISNTATGAGIYLTRETSYVTFGDHDILVRNNKISNVQTTAPGYVPAGFNPTPTYEAGIEIGAQMFDDDVTNPVYFSAFSVQNISLIGNTITNTKYDGIRAGDYSPAGSVSNLLVQNNSLTTIGNTTIVDELTGFSTSTGVCSGNTLGGSAWGLQCVKTVTAITLLLTIPGTQLQCDVTGRIIAASASAPLPPSAIKTH